MMVGKHQDIREQMVGRMYVVLTLLLLLPLAIVGRIGYLALVRGEELREAGERQRITVQKIPAMRGVIQDRAGRMLVVNTARFDLALDPKEAGFQNIQHTFFERLSRLTGRSVAFYRQRVRTRKSDRYVLLHRNLSEQQKEEIESWIEEWRKEGRKRGKRWRTMGILLQPRFGRRYTYGTTASHILGHVNTDLEGIAGIELQYDRFLQGVPGERVVRRDRLGQIKALVGGEEIPPQHGETVRLTIDLVKQAIMEEELARGVQAMEARWGTAIAVDTRTGAILAMANVPTYDPNQLPRFSVSSRRNHAITDQIEPGSTFKLVAAVAALEAGVVQLSDSIETGNGWKVFGNRTMQDTHAHGKITFAEAIAYSSNVGVALVADRMERGVFYQYARNFGFGQPTWIDLPGEVSGTLKRPGEWSRTTLPWMSTGYEVEVTPLQMLMAYAALANGGRLMRPYVVAERRDMAGHVQKRAHPEIIRRVMKEETARQLIPVFEAVVTEGTGKKARIPSLRIAGKTGTAQKVKHGRYQRGAYRSSFVGFFPADDPKVALIVVLDEPRKAFYGGDVAAPIFRRIVERWLTVSPELAHTSDSLVASHEIFRAMPSVKGLPVIVATEQLNAQGFNAALSGSIAPWSQVVEQIPEPGDSLALGRTVLLRTRPVNLSEGVAREVPQVSGWTVRDAMAYLGYLGFHVSVTGRGRVYRQKRLRPKHIHLVAR